MGLYGGELIYLLNVLSLFTSEQQGSHQKKVPSGYLGLVNFLAGQVTFKAYLNRFYNVVLFFLLVGF